MTDITTARLRLRPMRADDADSLLGVFGDPAVMAAFGRGPFTRQEMDAWVARNLEHQDRLGYGLFTIELREDGLVIGDCGLERMELAGADEVELGYDLRSDHWGRGLATEAAGAVVRHAREELGIRRLVSLVRATNAPSARVAERVGMALERELELDGAAYRLYATGD